MSQATSLSLACLSSHSPSHLSSLSPRRFSRTSSLVHLVTHSALPAPKKLGASPRLASSRLDLTASYASLDSASAKALLLFSSHLHNLSTRTPLFSVASHQQLLSSCTAPCARPDVASVVLPLRRPPSIRPPSQPQQRNARACLPVSLPTLPAPLRCTSHSDLRRAYPTCQPRHRQHGRTPGPFLIWFLSFSTIPIVACIGPFCSILDFQQYSAVLLPSPTLPRPIPALPKPAGP